MSKLDTPELTLGVGDVLHVMMADSAEEGALFAPLASGGTVFDGVRVNAKGQISLPYAGRITVKGLTLTQTEDAILKKHRALHHRTASVCIPSGRFGGFRIGSR